MKEKIIDVKELPIKTELKNQLKFSVEFNCLVMIFGSPNGEMVGDGFHSNWEGTYNDEPFNIYPRVCESEFDLCINTDWYIAAKNYDVAYGLLEYIMKCREENNQKREKEG